MSEPEFVEPDAVLFLHDKALREYGGIQGIKDESLLHSALGLPVNKLAYGDPGQSDLFDLAAAYAFGIARNHPFSDGNKRTAWSSCVLFLKINRVELDVSAPDVIGRVVGLAAGTLDEAGFAAWLRQSRRI